MGCLRIRLPGGKELEGHLIDERAWGKVREIGEGLGYGVNWTPPDLVVISEVPRTIRPETDLRLPSGAPADLLGKYLANTPLSGLGKDFVAAEERWRVNAVFACAVACHESDFGRSWLAVNKHNLFGFMAYDSDPAGSAKAYPAWQASIEDFCRLISREYLNPAGVFYSGPTVQGVGVRYASDPDWAAKVLKHCQAILAKAEEAV